MLLIWVSRVILLSVPYSGGHTKQFIYIMVWSAKYKFFELTSSLKIFVCCYYNEFLNTFKSIYLHSNMVCYFLCCYWNMVIVPSERRATWILVKIMLYWLYVNFERNGIAYWTIRNKYHEWTRHYDIRWKKGGVLLLVLIQLL